ncbi:PRC-barrel domain containing protein [Rhodobacteraceae bacterium CCMM004]|nr:PRC-barrel domain containing protein [Rhodobacteraceae bacterium CCMM004]
MRRFLMGSTAALLIAGGAYAETHGGAFAEMQSDPQTTLWASDLLGARIYATEAEVEGTYEAGAEAEWDDLGEINDMVIGQDGQVEAVILGIGGFLGIGERDVAVDMDALRVVRDGEDPTDYFLVVQASRAMVEQAPEYMRPTMAAMDAEMETVEAEAEEAAAETEAAAEEAAAETEAAAEEVAAETEAAAEEVAAETEAAAEEVAAETEEAAAETEAMAENAAADMERTMLTRPEVELDGFANVEMGELTTEELTGTPVYGSDDTSVGEIGSLILSDDGKTIERVVIDVGGFLGIGEKPIAVTLDELQILRSADGDVRVYIDSTEEALEQQPAYEG